MKKLLGFLLILASLGGVGYLYHLAGVLEMIQQTKEFNLWAPFQELAVDFPFHILILMGSIGVFFYSFKFLLARKAARLPPLRKTGDADSDRRSEKRRQAAVAANVRIPPRMPGALLMNSFFMVAAAIVLGVGAHSGQPKPTLSLIALVMAAQVVIGLLFMLLALIWEKSLFRPGSLMGIFVHLAIAGGLVYTLIRALPVLQNQPPPQ